MRLKIIKISLLSLISLGLITLTTLVQAGDSKLPIEEVEVIGITPTHSMGLPEDMIPYNVQNATSDDLSDTLSFDMTDFMNRNLGSVHLNDAQNNPLQPDLQFRGFTASPLLGLPQGLAIYQDGVRINEPFGDAMNWDLLPESSIASIDLIGGANPLFGLNTLGGALSITTKNGFTHPGSAIEATFGSFGRVIGALESGGNNGTFGYYFNGTYFDEAGWRDASPSDALNFFGVLSWENDTSALDLNLNVANTDLIGNGASPVELLELDRSAVFTSPDQTENELYMLNLQGDHWINNLTQVAGNIFYRYIQTDTFNGDGSEFEECTSDPGFLCEEDGLTDPIEDQFGAMIDGDNLNGSERNAINNLSNREQESFGAFTQFTFLHELFDRENQFIFGGGYQQGVIDFISVVEISTLNCEFNGMDCTIPDADRGTSGTGLFVPEVGTAIISTNRVWSLYATDTISLTEDLALTLSARYNNSHIRLGDRSNGSALVENDDPAAINGEHDYHRINPAIGLAYNINPELNVYGSYSESSRAPTPIELLCADPEAPCSLPNAFLADPPLEQVVTKSWEGGIRGNFHDIRYRIGGFHATNTDDIIFQATGGAASNEGFFSNVGDTRRLGAELSLSGIWQNVTWFLNYSFIHATFETPFIAASANHPFATDLNGDGEDNNIFVQAGDRIPGIPQHQLKLGADYKLLPDLTIGGNMVINTGQFLRGDEANLLDDTDAYAIVNLFANYDFSEKFSIFAKINNIFDTEYETFGLLGESDEVFDGSGATPEFEDPRFLGAGAPISAFVGFRFNF